MASASVSPFDKLERNGLYLAAVMAQAIEAQSPVAASLALDAYAPNTFTVYAQPAPYPSGYVFITATDVIAVFEPTLTVTQWIFNVLGSAQTPAPGVPGSVCAWFYAASLNLFGAMAAQIIGNAPGRTVTYIGNSLGGAIAQIMYQFCLPRITVLSQVYAFGAPRVGDQVFADAFGINRLFNIQNLYDPIPNLPPPLWAGVGSAYPIPGPPPFATYVQAGNIQTLDYQGYLVPGQTPTFTQAIVNFLSGTQPILEHSQAEYVRRLSLQINFFDAGAGADFDVQTASIEVTTDPGNWEVLTLANAPPASCKVEVFYAFQNDGFSEIWYSNQTPLNLIQTYIPNYVSQRLTLATAGCQALYARVSQLGKPRQVQFWSPGYAFNGAGLGQIKGKGSGSVQSLQPKSYVGTYNGLDVQAQQALLLRLQNTGQFWTRMFLHAFPPEVITGGQYTPTPNFNLSLNTFLVFLAGAGSGWLSVSTAPNTLPNRVSIVSITANPGRGATIMYTLPNPQPPGWPPQVGDFLTIGGAGALEVGMNGRKVVTQLVANPPAGQGGVIVGGSAPIGAGPQLGQAYFYKDVLTAYALSTGQIERLTTRKVGKPIFEPVGRRRNTIPLRR